MNKLTLRLLLGTCCALAGTVAPAWAEDNTSSAATSADALDEVVVTAQKRSERRRQYQGNLRFRSGHSDEHHRLLEQWRTRPEVIYGAPREIGVKADWQF